MGASGPYFNTKKGGKTISVGCNESFQQIYRDRI